MPSNDAGALLLFAAGCAILGVVALATGQPGGGGAAAVAFGVAAWFAWRAWRAR